VTDPERSEDTDQDPTDADEIRVWLVERTFSDDEQNIVILLYATPDGSRLLRKERALTSFTGAARETTASVLAEPGNLESIADPDERERYRAEVERVRERYGPDEAI
jgi:hypothetical protein